MPAENNNPPAAAADSGIVPGAGDAAPAVPDLNARLGELEAQLKRAGATLERLEQQGQLERAALEARAVEPVKLARRLAEEMKQHPTATGAALMARLKRDQPALFRPADQGAGRPPRSAMAPAAAGDHGPAARPHSTADLARRAAGGDHRALADFLRARRGE
ncbi:hypothetical protein BH11PLA1_BH11PLA1_22020 [soil metagenome]